MMPRKSCQIAKIGWGSGGQRRDARLPVALLPAKFSHYRGAVRGPCGRMDARLLALLGLMAGSAAAEPAPAALRLTYAAYAEGLNVMDLQASMAISPESYRLQVSYHLTGLVGVFFKAESTTTVDGHFRGDTPVPRELFSAGRLRGQQRVTQIDWQNGNPVVSQLVPPIEAERDPVPIEDRAHTVDTLSAMASLLRQVALSGRCEGALNTFDGRRLSAIQAHTVGEEVLASTGRSSFHGQALRCDFEGRQLGGFVHDEDASVLRRPQHGSAWFASLAPGEPPVPVRITFENRVLGATTVYLTGQN